MFKLWSILFQAHAEICETGEDTPLIVPVGELPRIIDNVYFRHFINNSYLHTFSMRTMISSTDDNSIADSLLL